MEALRVNCHNPIVGKPQIGVAIELDEISYKVHSVHGNFEILKEECKIYGKHPLHNTTINKLFN